MDPKERAARMEEDVDGPLWAGANVTHQGRFYRFEDVTIEPRPARGKLHVWIGGRTDAAIRRIARYGDGWFVESDRRKADEVPRRFFAGFPAPP